MASSRVTGKVTAEEVVRYFDRNLETLKQVLSCAERSAKIRKTSVCQWVYDPAKGEPNQDVQPGTPWSEVPDNFLCPECSLGKDVFDVLATEAK